MEYFQWVCGSSLGIDTINHIYLSWCDFYTLDALQVKMTSTLSYNTSTISPSVNLTCEASQFGRKDSEQTKPSRIEWFSPHNLNSAKKECKAGLPETTVLSCTLIVGVLTKENVGNYTCKASDRDNHCWRTTFELDFQGKQETSTRCRKKPTVGIHKVSA